jgi:plastocyanin
MRGKALGAAAALAAVAAACGGGSSSSPTPTPSGPTISITSLGVTPKSVTISRGSQVTFVNNDSRPHDMESDPHPEHTDCPEINSVGTLNPGQSRQTGNQNTVRTCGFHDHLAAENNNLRGSIVIQ